MYPFLFLYRLDMAIQGERCVADSITSIPSLHCRSLHNSNPLLEQSRLWLNYRC